MKTSDWHRRRPFSRAELRRWVTAVAIVGLGFAATGCAQSMSEFARTGDSASAYPASGAPVALTPSDPQVASVARPAVLVDETTVPAKPRSQSTRSSAPMEIAPRAAEVASAEEPDTAIAPAAVNLNQVPAQPKSKLLTPDEKAKVIAELEALAKKQSATLGKAKKSTACAADNLDPKQRLASATGDGGC